MTEAEIDEVIAKALDDAPLIFNSQELAAFIRMRLRAHGMEVVSVEAKPVDLVGAWEKAGFYVPPAPKRTI